MTGRHWVRVAVKGRWLTDHEISSMPSPGIKAYHSIRKRFEATDPKDYFEIDRIVFAILE